MEVSNLIIYIIMINLFYFLHEIFYNIPRDEAAANLFFRLSVLSMCALFSTQWLSNNIAYVVGLLILPPHLIVRKVKEVVKGFKWYR